MVAPATAPVLSPAAAPAVAPASVHPDGAASSLALIASEHYLNIETAFSEDAQYQVSSQSWFQLRGRVTRSGNQQASLDTIPLTPAQRQATASLVGQRLTGDHLTAWNNTTNPREAVDMAEVRRLWILGTPQSQQQARVLAREVFDRHVGRFWRFIRRSATRQDFVSAGMRFDLTASGAPRYLLPTGEQTGMTLDHNNTRLMDDPTQAVTGANLSYLLNDENSVTVEEIRNLDPFNDPPSTWTPWTPGGP
jgi:hypothetical protein